MPRRKLSTVVLCRTVIGASMAVSPSASAADLDSPDLHCEQTFNPPYDYPCNAAQAGIDFAWGQAGGVGPFVNAVVDEADNLADTVYRTVSCTVNPDDPDCA